VKYYRELLISSGRTGSIHSRPGRTCGSDGCPSWRWCCGSSTRGTSNTSSCTTSIKCSVTASMGASPAVNSPRSDAGWSAHLRHGRRSWGLDGRHHPVCPSEASRALDRLVRAQHGGPDPRTLALGWFSIHSLHWREW